MATTTSFRSFWQLEPGVGWGGITGKCAGWNIIRWYLCILIFTFPPLAVAPCRSLAECTGVIMPVIISSIVEGDMALLSRLLCAGVDPNLAGESGAVAGESGSQPCR